MERLLHGPGGLLPGGVVAVCRGRPFPCRWRRAPGGRGPLAGRDPLGRIHHYIRKIKASGGGKRWCWTQIRYPVGSPWARAGRDGLHLAEAGAGAASSACAATGQCPEEGTGCRPFMSAGSWRPCGRWVRTRNFCPGDRRRDDNNSDQKKVGRIWQWLKAT